MRSFKFLWFLLFVLPVAGCEKTSGSTTEKQREGKAKVLEFAPDKLKAGMAKDIQYFCPMHPYIVRDDPRYKKCPICFMPFAKQKAIPDELSPEDRIQQQRKYMTRGRGELVPAIRTNLAKLPAEDRLLVEAQGWCPILECNPLGFTGPPFKTTIKGQPAFLCCKDCEQDAKNKPDETLARMDRLKALMKKQHNVKGKIVSITVTIEHEEIPGLLKVERMEFSVEGTKGLESLKAGDSVQGKLKLKDGDYNIIELHKR